MATRGRRKPAARGGRCRSSGGSGGEAALPLEALKRVCGGLENEDVSAVKLVCKEWRATCDVSRPPLKDIRVCCSGGVSDEREQQSCRHLVRVGRGHGQTAAQVAASLATALRARGSDRAARSLSLNFAAWPTEESVTVTVMLWREAVAACPLADDLTLHLLDGDKWGGLAFAALPSIVAGAAAPTRRLHIAGREFIEEAALSPLRLPRLANLQSLKLSYSRPCGQSGFLCCAELCLTLEELLLQAPTGLTSLELEGVSFRARGIGALSTPAWGRLARLARLSFKDIATVGTGTARVTWPAHLDLLASLRDLEFHCPWSLIIGKGDLARLPTSLTRLVVHAHQSAGDGEALRAGGPAALEHAELWSKFDSGDVWDLSGLELGALTSLAVRGTGVRAESLPAWLPSCAALRELRLRTTNPRGFEIGMPAPPTYAFGDGPPGPPLPAGALAGLGRLELLEVGQEVPFRASWLIDREALRPFTAPGSTARFPAAAEPPAPARVAPLD